MYVPTDKDRAIGTVTALALMFVFVEIILEVFIRPKHFNEIRRTDAAFEAFNAR